MIGIIGAMENEVQLLQESITSPKSQTAGGFTFYQGKIQNKDIVLLKCGIGKVAAAVGCAVLIERFKPDFVINTGSAGGIHPNLKIGDVVISEGLVYHDVDVTAFNYAPGQLPGQPQIFPVEEKYIKIAEDAIDELKNEKTLPGNLNHVRGLIGSGDIFMHDPQKIAAVKKTFPEIAAVEMEGAAIAHSCNLFSVPYLVIRALSDVAGTQSPVSFADFIDIASKHSAEIVIKIVKKI